LEFVRVMVPVEPALNVEVVLAVVVKAVPAV
jgi:hypothetical protein